MHVMLDLETLGTRPGSVIASIGAVYFDPNSEELYDKFYVRIDPSSCTELGLTMDAKTVLWWLGQSEEARNSTFFGDSSSLLDALDLFAEFLSAKTSIKSVKVWGNGSDFDNVLLGAAYTAAGRPAPWSFSKNRCFRTVKNMVFSKSIQIPDRVGTHHNALDDAVYQAKCLQAYVKNMLIAVS